MSTARARVPILLYHAVEEPGSLLSVPPSVFAWQMGWLAEHGVRVLPLVQLVQAIREDQAIPGRAVVITFDDGFESVFTRALPILGQYGYPATVFVVPEYCGRGNDWPAQPSGTPRLRLMTWRQIDELRRSGIEIGAHGRTHARLDRVPGERLADEIVGAKAAIEDRLGAPVQFFAYPFGRVPAGGRAMIGSTYAAACTARPGLVGPHSDLLALDRIDACYLPARRAFQGLCSPLLPTYLRTRRALRAVGTIALRRPWA